MEKKTIVYAQFIGEDGSLGYKHGLTYYLILVENPGRKYPVCIFKINHGVEGHCYYGSLGKFSENWLVQNTYKDK